MRSNIVIGLKPGLSAETLIGLAREISAPDATLHLVSYVTVGRSDDEAARLSAVQRDIEALAAPLRSAGHTVETVVEIVALGLGSELTEYAVEVGADLIVIGLAKRTRVGKALVGGDAQVILLNAACPVLATRIG
jgi:nucleotide-binding universal stress UspA family protein